MVNWAKGFSGVVLLLLAALVLSSCGTIETGNVGIRTTLGKVDQEEIGPGVYFKLPLLSTVRAFSAKEIGLDMNDLTPKARDNLSLRDLDVTVYYSVKPSSIAELYTKYAAAHEREAGVYLPAFALVSRVARNAIYEETSKLDSLTMHTQREALALAIQEGLRKELAKTDPAIEKAIQDAVAAQKQLETTKQRIAIAEAEAEVEVKKAEGIAKANHIINQSLTCEYLQHESNLALHKFAEKGNATTVVIPANMQTAPLIQVNK